MRRISGYAALAAVLLTLVTIACKTNTAPEAPIVSGPALAKPGQVLTYVVTTTDPQGDDVWYLVSWGDGSTDDWGSGHPSGEQETYYHSYADSGRYYIKAKARDADGLESEWSDSVSVSVGFLAPNKPFRPAGPTSCTTGVAYRFSFKAIHPMGDSVQFQVWWGDTLTDWGPMTPSGIFAYVDHSFDTLGTYLVAARARDARGTESEWSDSLRVAVGQGGGSIGAPRSVTLAAATDTTVSISWAAPESLAPIRYTVGFRRLGYGSFEVIGETTGTSLTHDPLHHTGTYEVTAVYDSFAVSSPTTPATIPVEVTSMQVGELNASTYSGYGWDRTSFDATLYNMAWVDSAGKVDFYVSDFALGYAGPDYSLASPTLGPTDPGGGVPSGNWKATSFSGPLETDTVPLPAYSIQRYVATKTLTPIPCMYSCYTEDGYYVLLECTGVDLTFGTAAIRAWVQSVRGLRLIEN
jgi:hypothetical protein